MTNPAAAAQVLVRDLSRGVQAVIDADRKIKALDREIGTVALVLASGVAGSDLTAEIMYLVDARARLIDERKGYITSVVSRSSDLADVTAQIGSKS